MSSIKKQFSKAAANYDQYAIIQKKVGHLLLEKISSFSPRVILECGCGTGLLTEALANTFPYELFYAIDFSSEMIRFAEKRLKSYRVTLLESDFDLFEQESILYDLVFSNMAFHWSSDIQLILKKYYHQLSVGGVLAFSCPIEGHFKELPTFSRNHYVDFNAMITLLRGLGFKQVTGESIVMVDRFDSMISAMRSIKLTGASAVVGHKPSYNLGNYLKKHSGETSLTHHVAYFVAIKE